MEQTDEKSSRKNRSHKQTVCNLQDSLHSPGAIPKNLLESKGHLIFCMPVSRKEILQIHFRYLNFLCSDISSTWNPVRSGIYFFQIILHLRNCFLQDVPFGMDDCLFWFKIMVMLVPCIIGIAKRM